MDVKHLAAVEKWTLAFAALVVAFALLFLSRKTAFAVSLGAGVTCLNAWAVRKIGQRAEKYLKKPSSVVLLFNLKFLLLVTLIGLVLWLVKPDLVGFVVGISIFPAAIVASAISHQLRGSEETHG